MVSLKQRLDRRHDFFKAFLKAYVLIDLVHASTKKYLSTSSSSITRTWSAAGFTTTLEKI
jgi:hypothetical protein